MTQADGPRAEEVLEAEYASAGIPNSIAQALERSGRHPVLLFGGARAGKSTLLMSLFQCARRGAISIELGGPLGGAAASYAEAEDLFYRKAHDFDVGKPVPGTDSVTPFFIPIDIQPGKEAKPIKFAFLEGRGEWYLPTKTGRLFQEFKVEIVDVLRHFSDPLSVIYVAPTTIIGGGSVDTDDGDVGLCGAITEYRAHRELFRRDYHMFLLNKWDEYARPSADDELFSIVHSTQVEDVLNERYRAAWPAFRGIPLAANNRQRFFTQYAAANITGNIVRDPPRRHKAAFDRYPQMLWNWLFENAIRAAEGDLGRHSASRAPFPQALPNPRSTSALASLVDKFKKI